MISIEVDAKQLTELRKAVGRAKKNFAKELAMAINQVSKKTKLAIGRDVRTLVAMPKKESERAISIRSSASESSLQAVVNLKKTKRLGLRHFGARQDARGVSYKISKLGGRKRVDGAFQGTRPGVMNVKWKGNAAKRVGKSRNPIVFLRAVSAYGVYKKNELSGPQVDAINIELRKQVERRIKLNILRAEGLVSK